MIIKRNKIDTTGCNYSEKIVDRAAFIFSARTVLRFEQFKRQNRVTLSIHVKLHSNVIEQAYKSEAIDCDIN